MQGEFLWGICLVHKVWSTGVFALVMQHQNVDVVRPDIMNGLYQLAALKLGWKWYRDQIVDVSINFFVMLTGPMWTPPMAICPYRIMMSHDWACADQTGSMTSILVWLWVHVHMCGTPLLCFCMMGGFCGRSWSTLSNGGLQLQQKFRFWKLNPTCNFLKTWGAHMMPTWKPRDEFPAPEYPRSL